MIRTILAIVVTLSLAMLPAAAGFAAASTSAGAAKTGCCQDLGMPCNKAMDDGQATATCALHCFNYIGPSLFGFESVPAVAKTKPLFASKFFRSQTATLPLRPPRV